MEASLAHVAVELEWPWPEAATRLFADPPFDPSVVEAAIEGVQPARLFVDDREHPRGALLCRTYEYYLAGEPVAGLRRFVSHLPRDLFARLYGYVGLNEAWQKALREDLGGAMREVPRLGYRLPERAHPSAEAPAGIRIRSLDAASARRVDRELHQNIGLLWGGYEAFAGGGFGFWAEPDGAVAGFICAVSVSRRFANPDVETAPPYRRRGIARALCAVFIDECRRRGLTPCWECDEENAASRALARALGFSDERRYFEIGPMRSLSS
jgi:GNAT superfamily N-acetyltransferase